MQDFPSIPSTAAATAHRTQALSLAAGNTTLKIDQQTLNGNTSVSLTQVIDAKQTWAGEQLDLFEWKSVHRLHYQGRYQAGGDPYIYGFDLRLDQ